MIECYEVPTAFCVCGNFRLWDGNNVTDGLEIKNVVFYERQGQLETGMLGIVWNAQIAVSDLATKPTINDFLEVEGQVYKFLTIALKNQSPIIAPFYQCTLKTTDDLED